jgi:hypothetical protein
MNHCEVASIAGGVEGGGRLGDVLTNDRHVPDVAIAEPELVVSKADRPRIMRAFRLPQRFGQKCDAPGGLTAGHGQSSVHPP